MDRDGGQRKWRRRSLFWLRESVRQSFPPTALLLKLSRYWRHWRETAGMAKQLTRQYRKQRVVVGNANWMNGSETVSLENDIGFWISEDLSTTCKRPKERRWRKSSGSAGISLTLTREPFSLSTIRESDHIWTTGWRLARQERRQRQMHYKPFNRRQRP